MPPTLPSPCYVSIIPKQSLLPYIEQNLSQLKRPNNSWLNLKNSYLAFGDSTYQVINEPDQNVIGSEL